VTARSGLAAVMSDHRGERRRIVSLSAYAREADLRLLEVEVTDVCSEGCRIRGDIDLEQATRLWLRIPGVTPRPVRVAWAEKGQAGCTFEEPISADVLDEISRWGRGSARKLRQIFGAQDKGEAS